MWICGVRKNVVEVCWVSKRVCALGPFTWRILPINQPPTFALHSLSMFHSSPIHLKYPIQSQQVTMGSYRKDGDVGSSHKKAIADQILTPTMRSQALATKSASRLGTTTVIGWAAMRVTKRPICNKGIAGLSRNNHRNRINSQLQKVGMGENPKRWRSKNPECGGGRRIHEREVWSNSE